MKNSYNSVQYTIPLSPPHITLPFLEIFIEFKGKGEVYSSLKSTPFFKNSMFRSVSKHTAPSVNDKKLATEFLQAT